MTETSTSQLKIIEKDLFWHLRDNRILAHGVNCAGAMGAGIAVEFKKRWPQMYEEYRNRCREGQMVLGQAWTWREDEPFLDTQGRLSERFSIKVYNLAIKSHWRNPASYLAIEASVNEMLDDMVKYGNEIVAMPWIGCGLGGLDKKHVVKILKQCLAKEGREHQQIWVYTGAKK